MFCGLHVSEPYTYEPGTIGLTYVRPPAPNVKELILVRT